MTKDFPQYRKFCFASYGRAGYVEYLFFRNIFQYDSITMKLKQHIRYCNTFKAPVFTDWNNVITKSKYDICKNFTGVKLGGMDNNQMLRKGYVCHISRILIVNDNLTRKLAHLKCHVSNRKDRSFYFTSFTYHSYDWIHCLEPKAY